MCAHMYTCTQLLEAQSERGTAALSGPLVLLTSANKQEVDGVLRDELGWRMGRVSVRAFICVCGKAWEAHRKCGVSCAAFKLEGVAITCVFQCILAAGEHTGRGQSSQRYL
jgi:hypothetical protein